jgi:hypothetical protein
MARTVGRHGVFVRQVIPADGFKVLDGMILGAREQATTFSF